MKIKQSALDEILRKHDLWLNGSEDGERADLSSANLRSADLSSANLRSADFSSANLRSANLSSADLRSADLSSADLRSADFSSANLRSANLRFANLRFANLRSADLSRANLSSADLRSADLSDLIIWSTRGNNENIKSIHCDVYDVSYTDKIIQIGCENHTIEEWWKFSDKRILKMEGKKALKFWKVWKPIIKKIIKSLPAEPTGFKSND